MVQKRFSIALDIKRPTANRDFEVVEGDNGNVLEVTLTDDGAPVDLAGCMVCAVFSKSDGTAQQDNDGHGVAVEGNALTISLYSTSVAPGLVECELQVYSGDGQETLVTSAKFNFMCRRGIANDDTIEATDEWPLLVDMIQRTEAVEAAELLRVDAESIRVAQEEEREDAEEARQTLADKWENMELVVHGLPHTGEADGTVTEESDKFVVDLYIPQGEPGSVNNHTHGNITNDGRIGTTPNLPVFTGTGGVLETKPAAQARSAIGAADGAATIQLATGGTAPNFTVSDPSVIAYAANLRRTIVAHADSGDAPTLNFNGLGAAAVYQSTGKAASWKAGQHVLVEYDGTSFFMCSGGGGLPDSIDHLFAYTGRKRYELKVMDGVLYHLLTFETSGELTVNGVFIGDVWLVGGGGAGATSYANGRGGGGGYTTNAFGRSIVSGPIAIGAGGTNASGTGGATSYDGLFALGGYSGEHSTNPGNGGNGAGGGMYNEESLPGIGQGTTTRPFTSQDMPPMAGGGAGAAPSKTGGNGGSDGSNGTRYVNVSGSGYGVPGLYGGMTGYHIAATQSALLAWGGGGGGSTSFGVTRGCPGAMMIRIAA